MIDAPIEFTPRNFDPLFLEMSAPKFTYRPALYQELYNELEALVNGWASFDEMQANGDGSVKLARIPGAYIGKTWSRATGETEVVFYNAEFPDHEGRQEVKYVIDRNNNVRRG